jgi:hypothetical protein
MNTLSRSQKLNKNYFKASEKVEDKKRRFSFLITTADLNSQSETSKIPPLKLVSKFLYNESGAVRENSHTIPDQGC